MASIITAQSDKTSLVQSYMTCQCLKLDSWNAPRDKSFLFSFIRLSSMSNKENEINYNIINATEMCKKSGKEWKNYWRQSNVKHFIKSLPKEKQPIVTMNGDNCFRGTMICSEIAQRLQYWLEIKKGENIKGLVYIISSHIINAVKIGRWKGDVKTLRKRYITYYGPDISIHFKEFEDCELAETEMLNYFSNDRIYKEHELFKLDHLNNYKMKLDSINL